MTGFLRDHLIDDLSHYGLVARHSPGAEIVIDAGSIIDAVLPRVSAAIVAAERAAWDAGRASIGTDFVRPVNADGMREATKNPHVLTDAEAAFAAAETLHATEAVITVLSVSKLDRLPEQTVVLSDEYGIWQHLCFDGELRWVEPGSSIQHQSLDIALPATVIYIETV